MVHTLLSRDDTRHDEAARLTIPEEGIDSHFQAVALSQHRINQDERLARQVGRNHVLHVHGHLATLLVLEIAIGTDEGILRTVENIEEPLMQWQAGTEDGSQHDVVLQTLAFALRQRRLHRHLLILEALADFVSLKLADALQVAAETQAVPLDAYVAKLAHILINDAGHLTQIHYFHGILLVFGNTCFHVNFPTKVRKKSTIGSI